MTSLMEYLSLLAVAVLVGKVALLSFVVAPVLAKNLEREAFGKVVRQLFPAYYALGIGAACTGLVSVIIRESQERQTRCIIWLPGCGSWPLPPRPIAAPRSPLRAMP